MRTLALVAVLGLPTAAPAQKEFGFDNRKASGQPYLKPEETVARFKVAPEFEVKLFAGEPQLVNPIAFTIDEKGRVWVVECFEYPSKAGKNAPRDRIVILEDTDGDGACDKRTVFAEGKDFPVTPERKKAGLGAFDMASGIEVGHGGVFVGAPPYLWFIENKDDKPGKFEVLLKGFGSQDTHETLNTFQWGPDGWLYGLHGVFTQSDVGPPGQADGPVTRLNGAVWRYQPTKKAFEVFAEGTSNPWGMDWRNTDGQFILACCVIPHLYHIVPGGIYKRQAGASYNPHVYEYLNEICDHTFHRESGWAHAGLISLDAPHIPEKYRDSVIFGSIHGCSVKQNILKPKGSTFTASRGDDFLVSGDKNFRPINMKWGPNGDIYLIDWHDQNPCHQAAADSWDYERGRVYRIQLKGRPAKKTWALTGWHSQALRDLAFQSKDPWEYRTALRLLTERHEPNAGSAVKAGELFRSSLVTGSLNRRAALEASVNEAFVKYMAQNRRQDPGATSLAIRALVDRVAATPDHVALLAGLAGDQPSPVVRRELASAALRLADKHDVTTLVRALLAHKEDANDPVIPQLVWLAYEKALIRAAKDEGKNDGDDATDRELAWLAEQSPDNLFVRDKIVPKVMRRLVATGNPCDLKRCVAFVAGLKDVHSREKALDGLAVALAGQTVTAPEEWAALQAALVKENDPKLVPLVNKLAVNFRDPAAVKRAVAAATGADKSDARAEAVRQLGQLKVAETLPVVLDLLKKDPDVAVRAEAARALAAFDDPKVPAELVAAWKGLPPAARPDVVNTLASRKEWARALLQAMAAGTIDRAAVTDNTILRVQAFKDGELNRLVEKAWGRTRPTPAELTATIDKARASLHDGPGSFARGRAVFEANCAKCHKFDGKGAEVGPPLDGAARDIEYILTNVIDPNRVIGAPYFLRTARLLDGTVQQGVLAEEDDKSLTLKQENGVLRKIGKDELDGPVQVVEKSLMPEGLGYNMSPQDFRDLVRYLMAHPFLTEVTVNGEKVSAGVPGRVVLPDTKGGPAVVEAKVTAPAEVKTTLLVGCSHDFEVRLNGKAVGTGKGQGKDVQPDRAGFEVVLPAGTHTVAVVSKAGGGVVYARPADPDRKLQHPEPASKK
ncbi:MAG: HEAT repeat domain-containing protein [Gemmataceae bacterium]|nr:HEAT repeat domain-containing protein [Gemmataceae bacterium]